MLKMFRRIPDQARRSDRYLIPSRSILYLSLKLAVPFIALIGCLSDTRSSVWGQASANRQSKASFHIEVQDGQGTRIAGSELRTTPSNTDAASLDFDRVYQPGDRIIFGGPPRVAIRLDESMPECLIYRSHSVPGNSSYEVPYGRAEQQTGSAYSSASFAGQSHRVTMRALNEQELLGYRNLALNPCDLLQFDAASDQIFPHASSNSVSRSLFDFESRNAIDGNIQNGHHGVWPYESWGPQLRTDIWWKVDFGRPVELDKVRLMVRADFPHDSYWKSAELEFSDGSHLTLQMGPSAEFQQFSFPKRRVSWFRVANVVPEDPSKWCSFIEVEAWGRDLIGLGPTR
jgi:hypothetical protein